MSKKGCQLGRTGRARFWPGGYFTVRLGRPLSEQASPIIPRLDMSRGTGIALLVDGGITLKYV
jgi:hypothetical protein